MQNIMKSKLIILPTPIIVSDEEIKEGDWYFDSTDKVGLYPVYQRSQDPKFYSGCKKIIAGIPELPQIDWNGIESEFGYIDVDSLSFRHFRKNETTGWGRGYSYDNERKREGFIEGFKAAQQLNDKMFSLGNIKEALERGYSCGRNNDTSPEFDIEIKNFIQSLQPKVFDIEVEMEDGWNSYKEKFSRPKVTNGKIKILRKL